MLIFRVLDVVRNSQGTHSKERELIDLYTKFQTFLLEALRPPLFHAESYCLWLLMMLLMMLLVMLLMMLLSCL